jgi:leucyl-tRNA synthetase
LAENQLEINFEKMSKSKGNGIAPDTMASKYGVDTLRLALMFGGPPESDLNFDESFLGSMKSFLDKVAKMGEALSNITFNCSRTEL